jgi:hypothetical protein
MNEPPLVLNEREMVGIYLILKSLEGTGGMPGNGPGRSLSAEAEREAGAERRLNPDMLRLLQRIEKTLYERLTIQDLENLDQLYSNQNTRPREGRRR